MLPMEEDLLAEYVKAMSLLTIDPNQRLEQENQDLKCTQAQEIAKQNQEIARQTQEIERLSTQLQAREIQDNENSEEWQALATNGTIGEAG